MNAFTHDVNTWNHPRPLIAQMVLVSNALHCLPIGTVPSRCFGPVFQLVVMR